MNNPWQVDSVQAFNETYLKCPECAFTTKEETCFRDHAIKNHPLSVVFFGRSEEATKLHCTKRSGESLKRSGSPQSPSNPTKALKIKNCKVIMEKILKKNGNTSNNVMMKKFDKIEEKLESYESSNKDMKNALASNMETIDGLNSELDKISQILGVLTENGEKMKESNPVTKTFYSFYGNVMNCESFLDMEGLMTNYGITGKNITSQILSYLNFDSMVAARMVSKTWYQTLEDERGLWITLMKKCFEDIQKKSVMTYWSVRCIGHFNEWQRLGRIIEENGKIGEIVTFITKLVSKGSHLSSLPATRLHGYVGSLSYRYNGYYCHNDNEFWQSYKFLKLLVKHDFLHGLGDYYYASLLLYWSLFEIDALKVVVPTLINELQFKLVKYGEDFRNYGSSPIWAAIRIKGNEVERLKMLIPLATKKFWNSGKPIGSVDHTPLADAIMIGNVEMVKAIMPLTRLKANPKCRFGSYLHVAVKYGQFEIFKIIFKQLQCKKFDWLQLKDQEERNALELLKDKKFRLKNYNHDLEKPVKAGRDESKKYKQRMLKFIKTMI